MRRPHPLLPIVSLVAAVAAACLAPARAGDDDRIRLSAWKDGRLDVPRGLPSPWVPPSNPVTDAKLALGRRLFFDRTLSRDGTKGCVDCHAPEKGYGDGLATAVGRLLDAELVWEAMSKAARRRATGHFAKAPQVDAYAAYYEEILRR